MLAALIVERYVPHEPPKVRFIGWEDQVVRQKATNSTADPGLPGEDIIQDAALDCGVLPCIARGTWSKCGRDVLHTLVSSLWSGRAFVTSGRLY